MLTSVISGGAIEKIDNVREFVDKRSQLGSVLALGDQFVYLSAIARSVLVFRLFFKTPDSRFTYGHVGLAMAMTAEIFVLPQILYFVCGRLEPCICVKCCLMGHGGCLFTSLCGVVEGMVKSAFGGTDEVGNGILKFGDDLVFGR